jgi:low affinity Fe/Cu permease
MAVTLHPARAPSYRCGAVNYGKFGDLLMPRKNSQQAKPTHSSKNAAAHGSMHEWFGHFAQKIAQVTGKPATFLLAVAVVVVWALTGPLFRYSDTWQLVINTGTTIVTFLMVFLIQNTQNRDTLAIQLKLAEVILAMKGVPNRFATIEDLSDEDLEELHEQCRQQADVAIEHLNRRRGENPPRAAGSHAAPAGSNKKERTTT